MNTRIQQFLSAENLTQSQFADMIGVARAGVSHIIAGRNKPGFDFIERMARQFPTLNLEWLILGKGKMYIQSADNEPSTLFPEIDEVPNQPLESTNYTETINLDEKHQPANSKAIITKIIVFFSDGTFQEVQNRI